ncbi:2-phosphosulfolactate phosphatase [Plebeiibacterium marinum]|uniref:Probable 2-phosphosulfolactate phosphatase n=1 Tax=Plebeiibacterium marinum TaxID=2992111 RepID=A0AAE3MCE9_9BACT|nr:2-phosphosulfolactate phosphatase [Plebeiobacterium marinum]MCW3804972.1 2-phosphosulfolactate phosphatase [Plebeiobacterium marinum]
MNVDIILSAREIFPDRVANKTVVVIDVLRATSVMVTALANGAKSVIPVMHPEEAFNIKKELGEENVVLGGERDAVPIEGFDYGNSPFSYVPEVICDKTLVMTTTNGTRAILNSKGASKVIIGAFVNDVAIVKALEGEEEVVLVGSGSYDEFTMEDALCAGKLAMDLKEAYDARLTDVSVAMSLLYHTAKGDLHKIAAQGEHYSRLAGLGYDSDLDYCFRSSVFEIVPVFYGGSIVLENMNG